MGTIVKKNFDNPEEIRPVDKGKIEVVNLGDTQVMRVTFDPGWRWSECIKPIADTDSCLTTHLIHVLSGKMIVKMDDGSEAEFVSGDVGYIPSGHDAWIVGNEPFVCLDFQGGAVYATHES